MLNASRRVGAVERVDPKRFEGLVHSAHTDRIGLRAFFQGNSGSEGEPEARSGFHSLLGGIGGLPSALRNAWQFAADVFTGKLQVLHFKAFSCC